MGKITHFSSSGSGRSLGDRRPSVLGVRLNAARRHLTDAQKVRLGIQIEPDIAAIAKARKSHGLTAPGRAMPDEQRLSTHDDERLPSKAWQTKTQEHVAESVGIGSGQTYHRHKKVLAQVEQEASDLMPYVENGDLTINDVKRELKQRQIELPAPARPGDLVQRSPAWFAGQASSARRGD